MSEADSSHTVLDIHCGGELLLDDIRTLTAKADATGVDTSFIGWSKYMKRLIFLHAIKVEINCRIVDCR